MTFSPSRLRWFALVLYQTGISCDRNRWEEHWGFVLVESSTNETVGRAEPLQTICWVSFIPSEQAESELRFLGLIIFENRLKPGTTPAIQRLRGAHLACRMITGDNPLTAVSVARECSLISQAAHVFAPVFTKGTLSSFILSVTIMTPFTGNGSSPTSKIEWKSMDDSLWKLDSYSLKPLTPPPHHTAESDEIKYQDYSLVVTGDIFRWMINYAPLETLQRVSSRSPAQSPRANPHLDARQDTNFCADVARRKKWNCREVTGPWLHSSHVWRWGKWLCCSESSRCRDFIIGGRGQHCRPLYNHDSRYRLCHRGHHGRSCSPCDQL